MAETGDLATMPLAGVRNTLRDTVRQTEIELDDLAETQTGQDPGAPEKAQRRD